MKIVLTTILAALLLLGCKQQHLPTHYVVAIDTSVSIEPEAAAQCIQATLKLAQALNRGDTVTIIPITGDADIESTGRVIRFEKPLNRKPYDADLLEFSKHVQQSLAEFHSWASKHSAARTDIFGAVRMAGEEFATFPKQERIVLVIFSDFLQDDSFVNFSTDRRLSTQASALLFANDEAKQSSSTHIIPAIARLALLRSKELGKLNRQRREAIRNFWMRYFQALGMQPEYTTDGVGLAAAQVN
jgi:hypothetical protein